jgi:NTE family protein/lysophospholipid hydrolase
MVLGGGGARGFAHVGVLRALQEAGVPIDFIGGASMGSMPGATYALGWGDEEVMRAFRKVFVETAMPTQAYTLPLLSVFSPQRGERAMQRAFGDTLIEDLWLGYFCVASNITRGTLLVQRRGLLWRAMRASGSFPGLFPPVPERGELLVDGGLLNNLPIDVMQTLCPGPVIASDVSREVELQVDPEMEISPSAGRMLWSRINPWSPRIHFPGLGPVLLRSVECRDAPQKLALRESAAWYLAPPIGRFSLTDVGRLTEIVEIGYRYTRERLPELPPSIPRSS